MSKVGYINIDAWVEMSLEIMQTSKGGGEMVILLCLLYLSTILSCKSTGFIACVVFYFFVNQFCDLGNQTVMVIIVTL